jgi:hypothetical protein
MRIDAAGAVAGAFTLFFCTARLAQQFQSQLLGKFRVAGTKRGQRFFVDAHRAIKGRTTPVA